MDLFRQKISLVKKRPIISGLLIILVLGLAVFTLSKQHFSLTKDFSLEPAHLQKIYAPVSGFLQGHKLAPGGEVKLGDTLAVLVDTGDVEELEKLFLEKKREQVKKSIALLKNKPGDVYRAGLNLERLAGEIGLKKKKLASGRLICSSAGFIYSSQVEKGYRPYFSKGSELFEYASLDTFYIQVPLLESELGEIRIGDEAELRLHSALHKKIKGQIANIAPVPVNYLESSQADAAMEGIENKYKVKILVNGPDNVNLYPGMTGKVRIYSGKTRGFLLLWKGIKRLLRPDLFL
jgi:multidrug resistance efflux pump